MHLQPDTEIRSLADQLLELLSVEERLLREAREGVLGLYASLRKGNIQAVQTVLPANDQLAVRLESQAALRQSVVVRLGRGVGLTTDAVTLAALADRMPEPYQTEFRRARTTLRELTSQIDQFRAANANLIDRLRSYFRDVLTGFTTPDAPIRYGPSGVMLTAPAVSGTVVSG
jgi:hypothetical protein